MRKHYLYCLMSIMAVLIGIIFAISGVILQSNPLSRRSALLILSIVLVLVGAAAFAVNYKKYHLISDLSHHRSPIIAHWVYSPNTSHIIHEFISEQKNNSIATAILFLILSCIFCLVFAYSGGLTILYTGYLLIFICICIFILSLRVISAYYNQLANNQIDVIFGEDSIYFIDELYTLQRGYHCLQQVSIHPDDEDCLLFAYGLYDVDDVPAYTLTIPIPQGKMHTALSLKHYYTDLIKTLGE